MIKMLFCYFNRDHFFNERNIILKVGSLAAAGEPGGPQTSLLHLFCRLYFGNIKSGREGRTGYLIIFT